MRTWTHKSGQRHAISSHKKKCLWRPHERARRPGSLHAALARAQTLLTGRWQKNPRLRFKLPGFYSSKPQNSTSCHKQVDASGEREGASGLKNERSNSETSFDKSRSRLTLLSAPQGHIRGTRVTAMGLILFRGAVNS